MKFLRFILAIILITLCCVGCDTRSYDDGYDAGYADGFDIGHYEGSSDGYDRGYDAGYDYGYDQGYDDGYDEAYQDSTQAEDEVRVVVYVSRSGKIHRIANCSGMKYYTAMYLDDAVNMGHVFCENCY